MQLSRQKRFPLHEPETEVPFEELSISNNAPLQPIITPKTFRKVMGSRRNTAAAIIVRTGVRVTTMEASTGEVEDKPTTKHIWLSEMPKSDARSIIRMSFLFAFGALSRKAATQKTSAAPANRR